MTQRDLVGRVAIVTGANTGIGAVTARELAARGAHVFLACRSEAKTRTAMEQIRAAVSDAKLEYLHLDLADFTAVRSCAAEFLARGMPLHLLINNAGLAGSRGTTPAGFEVAFGVDHLGPFLFTTLLLDRIRESAPARIVTVASRAHQRVADIDFEAVKRRTASATGVPEYGVAKLANVLFSAELGRRLQGSGVTTYSLHPGVVASDIWRGVPAPMRVLMKLFMLSTEDGARTTLYCATSSDCAQETGLYYDKCRVKQPGRAAQNHDLAAKLWQLSETWTA